MADQLAILGGAPVRTAPFPGWPIHGREEEQAVARVARSGFWGRFGGSEIAGFEREFAEYTGARHAICVTSGTVALRVALWSAGVTGGDEVIVPPYTFVATASAVVENNATPVFVDVDRRTVNLDPKLVEGAITPRTKAIIPVHFAGCAADLERLGEIAARHGIPLIEDASHAHGGAWRGRGLGSIGDFGCFSFQASKNLNCGEGGVVLTSDDERAAACREFINFARREGRPPTDHSEMSSNYRMTEFQGAILRTQLARLPAQVSRREAAADRLTRRLAQIPGVAPQLRSEDETVKAYHLYVYRLDPTLWGVPKARVVEALNAEGIPAREGYPKPVNRQGIFTKPDFGPYTGAFESHPGFDYNRMPCPEGERACEEVAWLPHSLLLGSDADIDDVADAFEKVYERRAGLAAAGVA
jgi:dTDP-4-amino-4,6-dideoxygalactose transaminase